VLAGTSWWTRRLEDQADRYAASDGRLDALDEDSLLALFLSEASVPRWRATHPRWTTRLPVATARLPSSLRELFAEVDAAYADLTAFTGRRLRTPVVDLVRRLPRARYATGRWPRTVVVARDALTLPPLQLQPRLRAAIIAAHRLPRARATIAVFLGWLGLLATAYALGAQPARTGTLAVLCGIALGCIAIYERWRRRTDRHLANHSPAST